jgi:hypothetical protein
MYSVSFLLLASVYDALPSDLPVLRNPFVSGVTAAPKSAFMVPLKSDLEALEIRWLAVPSGSYVHWFTAGTLLSVVGGLALAFFRGRNVRVPWTELRISVRDKLVLVALLVEYLAMVSASLLISHRIH